MERSKKVVFVAHCLLNQNARAAGAERAAGAIKEVIQLLTESDVGIIQLPCPELEFDTGLNRRPKPRSSFDNKKYRQACKKLSCELLSKIEEYMKNGYTIVGLLGIEFSPTCSVYQIENGSRIIPGKGIFIEELEAEMRKKRFQVPIIGVNLNNVYSSLEKIQALLKYS
mgnify:CR=1 FL=1